MPEDDRGNSVRTLHRSFSILLPAKRVMPVKAGFERPGSLLHSSASTLMHREKYQREASNRLSSSFGYSKIAAEMFLHIVFLK